VSAPLAHRGNGQSERASDALAAARAALARRAGLPDTRWLVRYLPLVFTVTLVVVGVPVAFVWAMRLAGVLSSPLLLFLAALVMSMLLSLGAGHLWQVYGLRDDIVFSDLLIWGFARRIRQERALADAVARAGIALHASARAMEGQAHDGGIRGGELERLAQVLEGQDRYLNGHSRRVARHATMIAREMGFRDEALERLRVAAALHDVGKLLTPSEILNKPARLTDEEFEVIKQHPGDGAAMVSVLGDDEIAAIVRHHHERLDGNGYPDRLAGERIPLGARIVAVADTFDAITSARAYRGAARHAKAIAILRKEAGRQLDPDAVNAFMSYYSGSRLAFRWEGLLGAVRELAATLGGSQASAAVLSATKASVVVGATLAVASAGSLLPPVKPQPARAKSQQALAGAATPVQPRGLTGGPKTGSQRTRAAEDARQRRPGAGAKRRRPARSHHAERARNGAASSPSGALADGPATGAQVNNVSGVVGLQGSRPSASPVTGAGSASGSTAQGQAGGASGGVSKPAAGGATRETVVSGAASGVSRAASHASGGASGVSGSGGNGTTTVSSETTSTTAASATGAAHSAAGAANAATGAAQTSTNATAASATGTPNTTATSAVNTVTASANASSSGQSGSAAPVSLGQGSSSQPAGGY